MNYQVYGKEAGVIKHLLLIGCLSSGGAIVAAQSADQDAQIHNLDPLQVQAESVTDRDFQGQSMFLGGNNIVGREEISRSRGTSLEDLLRTVPGVRAQSRQGEDVFLNLRGSGIQSVVFTKSRGADIFLDGVPVAAADGTFDYTLLDPVSVNRMEVYRGAAARSFGGQTFGGVLGMNLFSPELQRGGRVGFGYGSFGTYRGQISVAESLGENSVLGVNYSHNRSSGYRDLQDSRSNRISAILQTRITDSLTNYLMVHAGRQYQQVSMPISQANVKRNPKMAHPITNITHPYYKTEAIRLADRIVYRSEQLDAEASIYYQHRDVDFRRPSLPPTGFMYGPGWLMSRGNDFGAFTRGSYRAHLFGHENIFSAGARFARYSGKESTHHNFATMLGPRFAHGRLTANQGSLWFENDFELVDSLHLLAGLQGNYSTRKFADHLWNGGVNQSGDRTYTSFTPSVGLRWDFAPKTSAFANYSIGKEPPAFGDLIALPVTPPFPQSAAWQGLNAQRAETIELGVQGEVERFSWQLSAYHSRLKNEILTFDDGTMTGNQVGRNAGRTVHQGIELAAHSTLWSDANTQDAVDLNLAYTWNRYKFDKDPLYGKNYLAGVPQQMLYAELLFRHNSGFYIGPNISGVLSDYHADNANSVKVNSYLLLGVGAGWEGEQLAVRLSADNLLNKKYVAGLLNGDNLNGIDDDIFFPGVGRSLNASIEWKW